MIIETNHGITADPATTDALEQVVGTLVGTLVEIGESYVILNDDGDQETYVQAAGTVAEGFIVERRDGCAGEHYRAARRMSAAELTTMLLGCMRGRADWSHVVGWHRVRVDFGAAHASA